MRICSEVVWPCLFRTCTTSYRNKAMELDGPLTVASRCIAMLRRLFTKLGGLRLAGFGFVDRVRMLFFYFAMKIRGCSCCSFTTGRVGKSFDGVPEGLLPQACAAHRNRGPFKPTVAQFHQQQAELLGASTHKGLPDAINPTSRNYS